MSTVYILLFTVHSKSWNRPSELKAKIIITFLIHSSHQGSQTHISSQVLLLILALHCLLFMATPNSSRKYTRTHVSRFHTICLATGSPLNSICQASFTSCSNSYSFTYIQSSVSLLNPYCEQRILSAFPMIWQAHVSDELPAKHQKLILQLPNSLLWVTYLP